MSIPLYQSSTSGSSSSVVSQPVNSQTSSTYAIDDSDRGKLLVLAYATLSIMAVTLPQAGASSLFISGWFVDIVNEGAETAKLTITTSTCCGAGVLIIPPGASFRLISDGSNYHLRGFDVALAGQGGFISAGLPVPSFQNAGSATNLTSVRFIKFVLTQAQLLSRVTTFVVTGVGASTSNLGLYGPSKNKLIDSGALATITSSVVITTTLTATLLLPGPYYFAAGSSSGSVVLEGCGNIFTASTLLLSNNTNFYSGTAGNAYSGGLLPSTLGTLTSANISPVFALWEA